MKPLVYVLVLIAVSAAQVNARASVAEVSSEPPVEETEGPEEPENPPTTTNNPPESGNSSTANPSTGSPGPDRPPQEGDACDPDICKNIGYCQGYLRCDRETGRLVKEACGEGLVWNPKDANGTDQIHGGNCDVWENLNRDLEGRYRADEECLACFWREISECNAEYLYQAPNLRHRNVLRLSCSEGLVFSKEKETCQLCSDVRRADGSDCCGGVVSTTGRATPEP